MTTNHFQAFVLPPQSLPNDQSPLGRKAPDLATVLAEVMAQVVSDYREGVLGARYFVREMTPQNDYVGEISIKLNLPNGEDSEEFQIASSVSASKGEPFVALEWGTMLGHFPAEDAIGLGMTIMHAGVAAQDDSIVYGMCKEGGMPDGSIAGFLSEMRKRRNALLDKMLEDPQTPAPQEPSTGLQQQGLG